MNPQTTPQNENLSSPSPTSCELNRRITISITLLFVIHIAIFAYPASSYFEQIKLGVIHPSGPLLGVFSDAIMFAGIALLNLKRCNAPLFLTATIGALLAGYLLWSQSLPFSVTSFVLMTYGFGSAISAFAWWAVARHKRSFQPA